jgi:ADP-ribose pyrophosphatase YjhB (NUDIX family)
MHVDEQRPVASVDLVVTNRHEEILLGRLTDRWSQHGTYAWGLPGREVMFGENLRTAAVRSLDEEVGLTATSVRFLSVNSNFGFGNHYICIALLVQATGTLVNKRPDDWKTWEWFQRSALPEDLFPSADRTLQAYLAGSTSLDL